MLLLEDVARAMVVVVDVVTIFLRIFTALIPTILLSGADLVNQKSPNLLVLLLLVLSPF